MTPAPVGCETGFAKRPGRRDPGSMSRPRRGARRDAWRGRRDQLAAVEQRLRGLRPPTQHLRRPPCPARPGKPAVPARAASGKDLECHRADGTDRRTAAAARQRARSHCSNASGSGSVTMAACSSPLLISSPIQSGTVSRFRRRPSDASRASSSSRQKCAGPMRRSDRGASHRDRGWRQLPHRPCRAFSLAQPPTRYEDLIQPAIGHCLRRTWSVGDNTGGAGVAPGAISCRVLPSAASYLSMIYHILGALAVLGSGVRAPSAPPKFRRQRLEAGDADGGSPAS